MEMKLETTSHHDEVDRISELPEHIIHHIMKLLYKTEDPTRISVLSKKFFSYWCSFPVLVFSTRRILSQSKVRDIDSVLNSIRYTFQHRRLNINTSLQRLTFLLGSEFESVNNSTTSLIHEMITFAIQKQVKELYLFVYGHRLSCFLEPVFSSKSITDLMLSGFNFDLEAQHLTLSLPLIECFNLRDCSGITSIILRGQKLRRVHFSNCHGLEKIQVDGPTSLDLLRCVGRNYCDINLASNKSVKRLELENASIVDKWFDSNFCRFVENLQFVVCSLPAKTRWYFDNLKRLELIGCDCKVEFETPNLEWFSYCGIGKWEPPLVISSRRFDAKLWASDLAVPIFWETSVIRLITQCQTLTLHCESPKKLIYPRAMRARFNPQVHDMKHLKIEYVFEKKQYDMAELIDSLLWLAPHLNTISFIDYDSQVVVKRIKFNYHEGSCCGSICDVECWTQHLKEVELHKFEDVDERTSLQTYFLTTYKISTVIIGHMHEWSSGLK